MLLCAQLLEEHASCGHLLLLETVVEVVTNALGTFVDHVGEVAVLLLLLLVLATTVFLGRGLLLLAFHCLKG